jgi:hypothetical protein
MELAGVFSIGRFVIPPEAETFRMDFIRPGHHWLRDIFINEFKEARRIWTQQSEWMWEKILQCDDPQTFKEYVLLKSRLKKLRERFQEQAPDFFSSTKVKVAIRNVQEKKRPAATASRR